MTKNQWGLVFGLFLAVVHAVWSAAVAIAPATLQRFIDWVLGLHHISLPLAITAFSLGKAVTLVILTFVIGYILGWIFGVLLKLVRA